MAAGQVKILEDEEIDLMEAAELREALKGLLKDMMEMKSKYKEKTQAGDEEAEKPDEGHEELKHYISGFSPKNVSKPSPWDGENEAEFKMWNERFVAYMVAAGDKTLRSILKKSRIDKTMKTWR